MTVFPSRLLTRVILPESEPLTLAEAKLYLRLDGSDQDLLIAELISVARASAEEYLRKSLMPQSWKLAFDCAPLREPFISRAIGALRVLPGVFGLPPSREVALPFGPVNAVASVTAYDASDNATVAPSTAYRLNAAQDALFLALDVATNAVRIEIVYSAGYADAPSIPKPIKYGMLAHLASLYDERGENAAMPPQAITLYGPYREVRL